MLEYNREFKAVLDILLKMHTDYVKTMMTVDDEGASRNKAEALREVSEQFAALLPERDRERYETDIDEKFRACARSMFFYEAIRPLKRRDDNEF